MCLRGIHKLDMRKAPEMPGHKSRAEMGLNMKKIINHGMGCVNNPCHEQFWGYGCASGSNGSAQNFAFAAKPLAELLLRADKPIEN